MTYGHAAVSYRERDVLTASPAKLVLIIYDHLLANLRRARFAIDSNRVDVRVEAVGKARDAVVELLASTDVERGGQIARNLRELYVFMFSELNDVVRAPDAARVDRLIEIVNTLRDGFATIAVMPSVATPAA